MGVMAEAERVLEATDPSLCDAAGLRELVRAVVRVERALGGHRHRIAAAAVALETSGSGPAVQETLSACGAVSKRAAKHQADQAAALTAFPAVADAAQSGTAHPENVAAVATAVRGLNADQKARLAGDDRGLAQRARDTRPDMFAALLRDRVHQIRAGDAETLVEQQRAASALSITPGRNGMWGIRGDIDPERGRAMSTRVDTVARQLAGDDAVTANHRAAALHQLVTGTTDALPIPRMPIGIIVDHHTTSHGPHEATVAETWDGHPVDVGDLGRLMCDADHHRLHLDPTGRPVWVTFESRTATRDQRLALRALHRTCPIDGTTPFAGCEIHHLVPVEAGGETRLDNLVPVSFEWHHKIHHGGWTLTMASDRTLTLHRPNGTLDRTIPPPTPITRHGP